MMGIFLSIVWERFMPSKMRSAKQQDLESLWNEQLCIAKWHRVEPVRWWLSTVELLVLFAKRSIMREPKAKKCFQKSEFSLNFLMKRLKSTNNLPLGKNFFIKHEFRKRWRNATFYLQWGSYDLYGLFPWLWEKQRSLELILIPFYGSSFPFFWLLSWWKAA